MDYGFLLRSILMQVIVFCIIPFIFWTLKKKKVSFFRYVGLIKPIKTAPISKVIIFAAFYMVIYSTTHFIPFISKITQPSANVYAGLAVSAIIPAILVSFIQQGLAEEVLFRGFIGKNFIAKFGFNIGNIAQAVAFGLLHILFSVSNERDLLAYFIIFTSTALGGWFLGYLDEKLCDGSIIPSVLLHGLGNFIMVMTVAF